MEQRFRGEELSNCLDRVFSMLAYAETKNGLLVSFYLVEISLINYLFNPDFLTWKLVLLMSPIYIGLIVILLSFFPIIGNVKIGETISKDIINFYFFGDLAQGTTEQVMKGYCVEEDDEISVSIVNQVIINSKIVKRKFLFFKLSIYLSFVLPIVLLLIISLFNKVKEFTGL